MKVMTVSLNGEIFSASDALRCSNRIFMPAGMNMPEERNGHI